jgi:hypothetical protein
LRPARGGNNSAFPVAPNIKVRMETQHPIPPALPRIFMTYYGRPLPLPFYFSNAEINMTVSIIIVPIQETLNSIGRKRPRKGAIIKQGITPERYNELLWSRTAFWATCSEWWQFLFDVLGKPIGPEMSVGNSHSWLRNNPEITVHIYFAVKLEIFYTYFPTLTKALFASPRAVAFHRAE